MYRAQNLILISFEISYPGREGNKLSCTRLITDTRQRLAFCCGTGGKNERTPCPSTRNPGIPNTEAGPGQKYPISLHQPGKH